MAQLVRGGQNYYEEVTPGDGGPVVTGDRKRNRKISRKLLVGESSPGANDAYIRAELAISNEMFPPFQLPGQYPTGALFFVEDFNIRGRGICTGEVAGLPVYEKYEIDVSYSPLPYDSREEDPENPGSGFPNPMQYADVSVQTGGEYVILPERNLWWGLGQPVPDTMGGGATTLAPKSTYNLTRHLVAFHDIPWDEINQYKGRVNAASFPANHFAFPGVHSETLLFMGATLNTSRNSLGEDTRSYTLNFIEWYRVLEDAGGNVQKYGWNYLYDPAVGQRTFRKVYIDAAATRSPYPTFPTSVIQTLLNN